MNSDLSNSLGRKFLLAIFSVLLTVALVEGGYWGVNILRHWGDNTEVSRFEWCGSCGEIYRHNPAHPDIDGLGFRQCAGASSFSDDSGGDSFRILILGDSVTYGHGVGCEEAFPYLLERLLSGSDRPPGPTEVINGGVAGYTTYNELQQYVRVGDEVKPDIVVLALVLNDVANPRLHWAGGGRNDVDIPDEAIPNITYDIEHAQPVLEQWKRELFRQKFFLGRVFARLGSSDSGQVDSPGNVPVQLTGEDDLPITVLTNPMSPESRWLEGMLGKLKSHTDGDGAKLVIMVVPLSYQLESDYPHLPQENVRAMCRRLGLPMIDLLPDFRIHEGGPLFLEERDGPEDIWHLSPAGHLRAAKILGEGLQKLDNDTAPSGQ